MPLAATDPDAIPGHRRKNDSLVHLLGALLDSAETVALAISNNVFAEGPLDRDVIRQLAGQAKGIVFVIEASGDVAEVLQ